MDQTPESTLSRFRSEARAVARLRHPNILEVHDFLEHDGVAYLVTEFVDGGTLAHRLGTPLAAATVEPVIRQIAAGLDFAHRQGVLHRDVKPSNILLRPDGTPVVADFGLAKVAGGARDLTQDGVILGTPDYMAPEQALGLVVDPRTDVYSLGVMVYRMVSGVLPFTAETPLATLYAHVHEPVPPLHATNPGVTLQIGEVIRRALAKSPEQRYSSAGEFAEALSQAIRSSSTTEPTLVIPRQPRLATRIPSAHWAPPVRPSRALAANMRNRVKSLSGRRIFWGFASSCATLAASMVAAMALWAITPMIQPRAHAPAPAVSAASNVPFGPVAVSAAAGSAMISTVDVETFPVSESQELDSLIVDLDELASEPAVQALPGDAVMLMLQAAGEWSDRIATAVLVGPDDEADISDVEAATADDEDHAWNASDELVWTEATNNDTESLQMFTSR